MSQNLPVTSDRTSPRTQGRRIGGLFSDLLGFDPLRSLYPGLSGASNLWAMEVSRSDGGYTIEFPVPGFRPEDIDVTVQGDMLTVSGKNDRRRLMRSITLPDEIDADSIAASVDNGMLSLRLIDRLGRIERARARRGDRRQDDVVA
jgi:HSP20 family molecular chaperone IbpA